jgi:hypothetical protein
MFLWIAFGWMVMCAAVWTWLLWHMERKHQGLHGALDHVEVDEPVWAECILPTGTLYGPVVNRRRQGSTLFGEACFTCNGLVDLRSGGTLRVHWSDFLEFDQPIPPQPYNLTSGDTLTITVSVHIAIDGTGNVTRAPVVRPPAAAV